MSTFKILKPITLTDSILVSTNVHEVAPAIYNSGTAYALGAFCHVVNGLALDIYESKQAANTGHAPASSPTWWQYRSSTYDAYASGTTYAEFARVIIAATHSVYESLQAGNVGKVPGTDTDWWIRVGSTNPWVSYDAKVGSQTQRAGKITFELLPGMIEGISFFNVVGSTIDLVMTDPVDGEVFNQTINLISTSNVFDAYSYCFAEFLTTKNHVETTLPPYSGATLSITINAGSDSDTAKCGEIAFGRIVEVGSTQYVPSLDIRDFSTKEEDIYGDFTVYERAFKKDIACEVMVPTSKLEYVQNIFEEYRSTPAVWILTEIPGLLSPYLTYAFYKRFRFTTPFLNRNIATIELIGLT